MPTIDPSIQVPSHIGVVASLVVDPEGRVSESGNSLPLSSPEDRARLNALRQWSSCILVGAATFRSGGYHESRTPVISYSRSTGEISDWNQELARVRAVHGPKILIEAGPNILEQLLEQELVERLYLTKSSRESKDITSPRFNLTLLEDGRGMKLIDSIQGSEDRFEVYER